MSVKFTKSSRLSNHPTNTRSSPSTMSTQCISRRSDARKKFSGSPLKLPNLNTTATAAINIPPPVHSPGWLERTCFMGPLTPLTSEGDCAPFDIDEHAHGSQSRLQRICLEGPLTLLPSEDDSLGSPSDFGGNQVPLYRPLAKARRADYGRLPPALTREMTYETFDGPLTPLGSDMETGEGDPRSMASASWAGEGEGDIYVKASMFDAAHACGWFPDPPQVPEGEAVVSKFADLEKMTRFPPSAWRVGPDGLVRNYDVTYDSPSRPVTGPLQMASVVEREVRALMRRKEVVRKALEEAGDIGMDEAAVKAEVADEVMRDWSRPKLLGPEGTEIYDGVIEYPEDWATRQSSGLQHYATEMVIE